MKRLALLLYSLTLLGTATVVANEHEDEKKPSPTATQQTTVNDDC